MQALTLAELLAVTGTGRAASTDLHHAMRLDAGRSGFYHSTLCCVTCTREIVCTPRPRGEGRMYAGAAYDEGCEL